jgi:hypothetical protein
VGTILGIALAQAHAGNVAGAERVRNAALAIVESQLTAVRASRGALTASDPVGLVPALRTAAVQGIRALSAAKDANTSEIVRGFLQRLLARTDAADGFPATLAAQLSLSGETLSVADRRQLVWDCGARAIELNDRLGLRQVQQDFRHVLPADTPSVELAGRLVQLAAVARPSRAEALWGWYEQRCGDDQALPLTAMRIGASALTVGHASLALVVALRLRAEDSDAWAAHFGERSVAEAEKLSDELYGQLLGADPQRALEDFARFVGTVTSAIEFPASEAGV